MRYPSPDKRQFLPVTNTNNQDGVRTMRNFAIACVAVMGLMVASSAVSEAGHGYYGGHGYGGHGVYGGYGYTPHVYHNTSHWDYHPGQFVRHRNHYHYQPGHYDFHQTGHYDTFHNGHIHHGH